jgi:AcrR family transcriptional regulator
MQKISYRPRIGRPHAFDHDEALEIAMDLFWRFGYEAASVSALTKAMGITPPSLYAAFGSKRDLYKAVLRRYQTREYSLDLTRVKAAVKLTDAVQLLLEHAADFVTSDEHAKGCMIMGVMSACAPDEGNLAADAAQCRKLAIHQIFESLSSFGSKIKIRALSRYLCAVIIGMTVQAREGSTRRELQDIVDVVVSSVSAVR